MRKRRARERAHLFRINQLFRINCSAFLALSNPLLRVKRRVGGKREETGRTGGESDNEVRETGGETQVIQNGAWGRCEKEKSCGKKRETE